MPGVMGGTHLHTPQSIFQHTMSQFNGHPEDAPWMQVPHIPQMTMPWSMPVFQQPDVIRFTGEKPKVPCEPILHQKRKLDLPPDVVRPTKHFITEEKMAAHFQGLNLNATEPGRSQSILPMGSFVETKNECPKLVISDEVKNIQPEPVLPLSIMSKLERPSMALVLWQPPSKHLHNVLSLPKSNVNSLESIDEDLSEGNNNDIENNNINNNNEISDMNQMMEDEDLMDVEAMGL